MVRLDSAHGILEDNERELPNYSVGVHNARWRTNWKASIVLRGFATAPVSYCQVSNTIWLSKYLADAYCRIPVKSQASHRSLCQRHFHYCFQKEPGSHLRGGWTARWTPRPLWALHALSWPVACFFLLWSPPRQWALEHMQRVSLSLHKESATLCYKE